MFWCESAPGGSRLAQKPLAHDRVGREMRRQRLDRDAPIELEVAREVDDAHAAAADLALELVLPGERGGEAREVVGLFGRRRRLSRRIHYPVRASCA